MTLEQLQERKVQLETAINQTTNQVYIFQGHKQEVEFQIAELLKLLEEIEKSDQTHVE